jgi:hypothetical protein
MASSYYDGPLPRMDTIRRVPTRYQRILPLELVKQYQCIVIGAARGVLTVAITDIHHQPLIYSLEKYTGRHIFAVLVEPTRMRLLIERLERCYFRMENRRLGRTCYIHQRQLRAYTHYIASQR